METINSLLMWTHLAALVAGGAATLGLLAVGMVIRGASPEAQQALFKVTKIVTRMGRDAYVVSISTGPLLFSSKWNGSAPEMAWFIAKMVLVGLLLIVIIWTAVNNDRAIAGDLKAANRTLWIGLTGSLNLLAIILCAAFAFNY